LNQNTGLLVFGFLVWLVGVIWSSSAGWSELEKSNPDKMENNGLNLPDVVALTSREREARAAALQEEAKAFAAEEERRRIAEVEAAKEEENSRIAALEFAKERRDQRAALLKSTKFRLWVVGGVLLTVCLVLSVVQYQNSVKADAEKTQRDSVQAIIDAAENCGGSETSLKVSGNEVKMSISQDRALLDCVLIDLTGKDFNALDLVPSFSSKLANGYEFLWRSDFVTITRAD
jgi:hypothetical protein